MAFQSFPFQRWVMQLSPQLHHHHHHPSLHPSASWQRALLVMDRPGECPLCQRHPDFPLATKHLLRPQRCKFTMCRLTPAGKRFPARAQKRRMGGDFNPGTEAENQGEGPTNSSSDDWLRSNWQVALEMVIGQSTVRH